MLNRASLNHIYRTVWNQSLGAMVAVAEISTGQGCSSGAASRNRSRLESGRPPTLAHLGILSLGIAMAWGALPSAAVANPVGGVAVHGQAGFNTGVPNKLLVTTQNGVGTNHSAINWQSFSLPAGNTTYFQQPNAGSTVINRVVTNTPSLIFGALGSNGNLVLVNQSGIAVGAGAVVDTAGFTASALGMSDADALLGRLRFGSAEAGATGVSVHGQIMARSGDLVLIAPKVDVGPDALIRAPNGSAILAAGQQVEITGRGLEGIRLQVQAPTDAAVNLGSLQGNAVGMFASTLRHSGSIQATAVSVEGGKVVLKALDPLDVDGRVRAQGPGGQGGVVHATGGKVTLSSGADIDVSGVSGGGEALIGGGWQGHDPRISNAQQTVVATGARINADATERGNGGTAVVWADGFTGFGGSVSARGGALGGDGGQAEVSGKQYLDFRGVVDLTAPLGRTGSLLLDPASITIGTVAEVDGSGYGGDVSGNIASGDYFGVNSQITAAQVATLLNSASLSLAATGNIDVTAAIAKTGSPATTLTLQSDSGNISVNAPISTSDGALGVTLTATSGNVAVTQAITTRGGDVTMGAGGALGISTVGLVTKGVDSTGSSNGTAGGAVNLNASVGNVVVGGIDSHGGFGGNSSFGGFSGGNGGNVSLVRGSGDLTLSGLSIDTSGGAGGNATQAGYGGGVGGYGGNITLQPTAGKLTLGGAAGSLISSGANGGDAFLFGTSATTFGGSAGGAGTINLGGSTRSGGTNALEFSGNLNLNSAPGFAGKDNTGVQGVSGVSNSVQMTAGTGGISQTGGAITGGANIDINSVGSVSVTGVSNAFNHATGSATAGAISMAGVTGVGTSPLTALDAVDLSGAGNIDLLGNITSTNGSVSVSSTGGSLSSTQGNSVTAAGLITLKAKSDVTLKGAILTSSSTGDAVVLKADGALTVTLGLSGYGGSVSTPNGRALAYVNYGPTHNFALLAPSFKQYNYTTGATILGTGNGVIYSNATPAVLTSTLGGAASKIYDAGLDISLSGVTFGSLSGAIDGDILTGASLTGGTGSLSDKNVGTAKLVTVSGMTLSGVTGGNGIPLVYGYLLSASGIVGNVTPKTLTESGLTVPSSKVYDATTAAVVSGTAALATESVGTGSTADGKAYSGDAVSLTGTALGTYNSKDVATATTVSFSGLTLTGTQAGNYTLSMQAPAPATITPKSLSESGLSVPSSKVYDATTAAVVSGSAALATEAVGTGSTSDGKAYSGDTVSLIGTAVGTYNSKDVATAANVSFSGLTLTGTQAGNYTLSMQAPATATITPKALNESGLTVPLSKVYDATTAAVVSGSAALATEAVGAGSNSDGKAYSGDVVSLTGTAVGTYNSKDVATATTVSFSGLALTGAQTGNYSLIMQAPAPAAITPKALSASVSAPSKVYDGNTTATPTLSVTGGLVGSEVVTAAGTASFNSKDVLTANLVTVNSTTLVSGSGLASNYSLAAGQTTTASITPKGLSASVSAPSKVYDGNTTATPTLSVTGGLVGSEVVTASGTASFNSKDVLTANLVTVNSTTLADGSGGGLANNYSLAAGETTTASITPKGLSASVSAPSKVYDGNTTATPTLSVTGGLVGSEVVTASGTASFNSKDVLTANLVTVNSTVLADGSGLASNYSLAVGETTTASITPKGLSASVSAPNKVYDGNTTATPTLSITAGLVGTEVVTATGTASFNSKDVLTANLVTVNSTALANGGNGGLASNYSLAAGETTTASITVRPLSTWTASGSGQWSLASNWDALPDGANVLAVAIPAGATVVYDAAVGSTKLQSITSAGALAMTGGNLSVAASLSTPQYSQTGGALSGPGSFNANGSFNQSGGTISMGGPVTITQSAGNLSVGSISASSIKLSAPAGSIGQSAGLVSAGLLTTDSGAGTLLNDAGNRIASFKAATTGVGNIELTNVGALDVQGINAANGNITLVNTGGISTSGAVLANNGGVSMTANSPLTIGTGGIQASANISLTATNLTSAGNMTLDGNLTSSGGAIALNAANNFVQNSVLTAAQGITATAGGSMTFGPSASSVGNPLSYTSNGVAVFPPGQFLSQVSTPADAVVAFLSDFESLLAPLEDPLISQNQDNNGTVTGVAICFR